ncbi:MAG: sigma-54-dependent Fis family transcriptional regulator [Syntrophaceae bacterium]|nr:sigma-54-dependent Fis family transcriptional regulator [Syntrophaceae bacterium]
MNKILIVDDESDMRLVLSAMLKKEGFDVASASNGREALQILKSSKVSVVVTDLKMSDIDGMELLNHVSVQYPEIPVIMITAHGTVATAVEAMKKGALDYITKPFDQDEFKSVIFKAMRTSNLKKDEFFLPPEEIEHAGIIGTSKSTLDIFDAIKRVAPTTTTVMITGETGTGKELVADAIHNNSPRKNNPLIKLNCAAIAATLMESELFGYEKGAFTGAIVTKPGKFELAHTGTLFLDEVAEIPQDMQVKLLRVIQEQQFERVGGLRTIKVDVRIIAATNQNLLQQVKVGNFREDLYYRLNVFPVDIPPLRKRKEDILPLIDYFLNKFNKKLGLSVGMENEVKEMLPLYEWPGNIRELENLIERMMLLSKNNLITSCEIPAEFKEALNKVTDTLADSDKKPFKEYVRGQVENVEKQMIVKCLEESGGNITRAAKKMGLSRKGLQLKMIKYNLRK